MWHLITKWKNKAEKIDECKTEIHLSSTEARIKMDTLIECAEELKKALIKESK
jgi:hypothetical protein